MQELPLWPAAQRRAVTGLFTDIDDTLTTEGEITADAMEALGALKAAGLKVVAITGRPVGWSQPFAARWPVDAIVAENGAVALLPDAQSAAPRPLSKIYQQDAATRRANFARMAAAAIQARAAAVCRKGRRCMEGLRFLEYGHHARRLALANQGNT